MQWKDAIQWEQKALQALLRAEATFRKIEIAFGQRGAGGAGGGSAGRDLASLFDLELDTEKNQYETAQKASPAEQHEKDVEEALQKLDALAKRQEDLANQQRNPQQSFQERWQQEMLRREAEQLQRQIGQMTRSGQQGANGAQANASSESGSGSAPNRSGDPRTEQALERLRQATDAMKRADGSEQGANAAGQRAAEQLRQAANLLAGTQQRLASGRMDSLAREASRLTQEERAEADQISKFVNQQGESNATNLDGMTARVHERNRLAEGRQRLSDDLSRLQGNIRDTAREMASAQPEVARKLREALTEMDESDLDNHVQRTADWLRRGIDPNSNGTEKEIAGGLEKLERQLQEAQKGIANGKAGQPDSDKPAATAALDQVERLRSQLEAMTASRGSRGDSRQSSQQQRVPAGEAGADGLHRNNNLGDPSGDMRSSDGAATDGTAWGNINTGNNRYGAPGERPTPAGPSGEDTERIFQQGMRDLDQLRRTVQNDPQAAKEVAELTRQMQRLDPSRFPGNPAMVERMQRELLSSFDRLELLLRRDGAASEARTGKSYAVPAEYQESVAEYYRRLSKNP